MIAQRSLFGDEEPIEGEIKISKAKAEKLVETCRKCGHERGQHDRTGVCFSCSCRKFKRKKPKISIEELGRIAPQFGKRGYELRAETPRRPVFGWFDVGPNALTLYFHQFQTKSANVLRHFAGSKMSPQMMARMHAADANKIKQQVERTSSAIEQAKVHDRGMPDGIRIERVSAGSLDGDNLQTALKHVRDGIAEALHVDDRAFDFLEYSQLKAPRYVHGVLVTLTWKKAHYGNEEKKREEERAANEAAKAPRSRARRAPRRPKGG